MKKTALEEKIAKNAQERFEKELRDFCYAMTQHPIASQLKVQVVVNGQAKTVSLFNFGGNYALVNASGGTDELKSLSNLDKIKEKLIEKYIDDDTVNLLEKLESIEHLFSL